MLGVARGRGFSLIELVIVMAIIAILAAITFPMIFTATEAARRRVCVSQLRQIGMAITMYANDHGGRTPPQPASVPAALGRSCNGNASNPCSIEASAKLKDRFGIDYTVADVLAPYVGDRRLFTCPSAVRLEPEWECFNWTYVLVPNCVDINRGQRDDPYYGDPSRLWLATDVQGDWGSNHTFRDWAELRYINVLYLDGHCRGRVHPRPSDPGGAYSEEPDFQVWPPPAPGDYGQPLPHRPRWRESGWRSRRAPNE